MTIRRTNSSNSPCCRPALRAGLTLLELVIVLAILVVLSGMVVPLITGLGFKTNASANVTLVNDVNKSVRTFHARQEDDYPNGWDSLVTASGELYTKLHGDLVKPAGPILQVGQLTDLQSRSLIEAGITRLYAADESQANPNAMSTLAGTVAAGMDVATLRTTGASATLEKYAFNLNHLDNVDPDNVYVVLGLGQNTTIRGAVMTDVPLVSAVDPNQRYARMLCVFMVPGPTTPTDDYFTAKYVGCFLPDGTSQSGNQDKYNGTD